MAILDEIRKLFSDLRTQVIIAIISIGIISFAVPFGLFLEGLISYEVFDFSSTGVWVIGSFIATLVLAIRSKDKKGPSVDST